jgi:hypothetical protein
MENGESGSDVARVTSLEARMMAEYADGLRGEGPKLVVGTRKPDGFHIMDEPLGTIMDEPLGTREPCSDETSVVIPVDTKFEWPDRPKVKEIEIRLEGGGSITRSDLDAVFLSESAVEKFLFPYLASKYGPQAAAAAVKLAQEWYGRVPPLEPVVEDGSPVSEELVPFAVGHLPRSEYVILDEVEVLLMDRQGTVTARRLSGRE